MAEWPLHEYIDGNRVRNGDWKALRELEAERDHWRDMAHRLHFRLYGETPPPLRDVRPAAHETLGNRP